ncbi:aminoglycoside phosphotransferase family protein [Desulfoluna sp.]|uniref:phosphotransferase enzyme family protein n=1 Tax=Desulfoluna sp. TaxID=2045199 RepID=UPI002634B59E|nr:aminoglycoside phosphotransferase family protein [Desulfoluna sp.]
MQRSDGVRALGAWGVRCAAFREDLYLAGSPERCLERTVVEGGDGALFLLERIDGTVAPRKREMGRLMRALARDGLPVAAPLMTSAGEALVARETGLWQLTPFVQGISLDRPGYTREAWRGHSLAIFLENLRAVSHGLDASFLRDSFNLPAYIETLTHTLEDRHPRVAEALAEATAYLRGRLFPCWQDLPTALAHGDVHGMNILWGENGIASVIDWEFFGRKPLLYDVANMVGCCGMETPDALLHGLAPTQTRALHSTDFADTTSWNLLPECIMALRYAWLSEWLRKADAEMINLELSYIYLLMDNREKLVEAWGF